MFFSQFRKTYLWSWKIPAHIYLDRHINILKLASNTMKLHLRVQRMPTLAHALDGINRITTLGWINHESITNSGTIVTLLI